jgi:hypothetical protein
MKLFITKNQLSMKRILKIAAVALVVMLGSSWRSTVSAQPYDDDYYEDDNYSNQQGYDQQQDVDYQTFYDELSPHGRWVDYPDHGYVWVPDMGPDFRPYSTGGHWVWTDNYEWMWVSDYSWGWAPFHYGRWFYDSYYGWVWVPGYEWSPAWVAWRDGGDYYGWAPIRPGITISIGFNIGNYSPPYDYWCFAPRRYITSPRIYNYCVDRRQNVTIINQTTIINNYSYSRNVYRGGPRRADVEVYTGRITPVRFAPSSRPGRSVVRNNQVNIYRPNVRRDNNRNSAPRTFDRYSGQRPDNRDRASNRPGNTRERNGRIERNDNNRSNGNNLPRSERGNNRAERPDRDVRQQGNTNSPFDRQRRVENNNRNEQRQPGNNRTMRTPSERPDMNQGNRGNGNMERRRVERNDQPVRQPNENRVYRQERQQNAPVQRQPNESRVFRQERQQSAPVQRQPQMRNEQRPSQQQQSQQRQVERRNDNGGNNDGGGRGNGRGRRQ